LPGVVALLPVVLPLNGTLKEALTLQKSPADEEIVTARRRAARGYPCAACEIYLGMQRRAKWLERPDDAKG
jgi:hypothetical protein